MHGKILLIVAQPTYELGWVGGQDLGLANFCHSSLILACQNGTTCKMLGNGIIMAFPLKGINLPNFLRFRFRFRGNQC